MNLKSIVGFLLYDLIAKHLPSSASYIKIGQKKIRWACAKLYLKKCGKNVNIDKNATISKKCSIGDNSGIGENAYIGITVDIGNDVLMGADCLILTRNHEFTEINVPIRVQGYQKEKQVKIGNDVWIGSRVTILGGVTIGNHCIIGAGAVVTHDIPDYAIAAGNPCKIIRMRNESEENK